ncbi:MAG TPA: hypothetical protein VMB20_01710 [Candidatus Acidoferrum sp.]|nr:hypothetical protein [Candidatus Acidoferrum sp.]
MSLVSEFISHRLSRDRYRLNYIVFQYGIDGPIDSCNAEPVDTLCGSLEQFSDTERSLGALQDLT